MAISVDRFAISSSMQGLCGPLIVIAESRIGLVVSAIAIEPLPATAARWPDQLLKLFDRYRLVLLGLVVVIYLAGFNGLWQIESDSALYLSLGRNVARGDGYTFRGEPDATVLPGLPYALAGCFKLFGAHAIVAADAMILLCGLATLACTYRMVYLAFGRPTAVGIAFGFACLHEFHRYCYEIMTETPFLAGVTAFLAGYQAIFGRTKADPNHRACWWDWVLLLGGMAVGLLVRPNMIPMLGILMVLLLWRWIGRDKRLVWAAIGLAIMAAAVAVILLMHHQSNGRFSNIYMETLRLQWQHPGVWLRNKVWPNVMDVFGASAAQSTFAFKFGNDWLNLMFGGLALASALALFRYEPLWGWWVAATIATMILVQSHDRYLLAIGPLLSLGWWRMIRRVHLSLPKHAANVIFLILLGLGTGVNGTRVGQLVGRQHRHPFYRIYKQGKYASVIEVAESIGKQATSQDVIVTPNMDERIYSFLCDHPAYSRDEFNTMKLAYRRALVIVDPPGDDGKWLFAPGTIFLPYPEPLTPALRPGRRSPIWVYSAQRPR